MITHSSPGPDVPARPRSLVTGATGLLGSNLVRRLLDGDEEVVALVRDADRAKRLLPDDPRLRVSVGDITDPGSYRHLLEGVDEVFHTAAYFREYYQNPAQIAPLEEVNVSAV
jgi:dihydroflavonol-4-reductase